MRILKAIPEDKKKPLSSLMFLKPARGTRSSLEPLEPFESHLMNPFHCIRDSQEAISDSLLKNRVLRGLMFIDHSFFHALSHLSSPIFRSTHFRCRILA